MLRQVKVLAHQRRDWNLLPLLGDLIGKQGTGQCAPRTPTLLAIRAVSASGNEM